jgi:hypothetical protein
MSTVERHEMFDSLEFHEDLTTHDEIREIAGLDFEIIIADRQTDLQAEWDAGLGQLVT